MTGPWTIRTFQAGDGRWTAQLLLNEDERQDGQTFGAQEMGAVSEAEAIDRVKDYWRAELQEPFTDQDFTIQRSPAVAE